MMIDMNIPQVVELEQRRQVLAFEIEHGRPATARQASLVDLLSGQASAGPRETEDWWPDGVRRAPARRTPRP